MGRRTLSKELIVDAAFAQLAEGGLTSVTARALGERLGVRAGALYYHVPDMSALHDEMATVITRELLVADVTGLAWDDLLRSVAHRTRDVLLTYRDGARLLSGKYVTDDAVLRAGEAPLRVLVDAGFSVPDARRALQSVHAFVTGFVIEEQHRAADARYSPEARSARLDPVEHPLSTAASTGFRGADDTDFRWGVEALVAGIGATVATH